MMLLFVSVSVESNYPIVGSCGCGSMDSITVTYFDNLFPHAQKDECTPYEHKTNKQQEQGRDA